MASNPVCYSFRKPSSTYQHIRHLPLKSTLAYLKSTGWRPGQNIRELRPAENGTIDREDTLLGAAK